MSVNLAQATADYIMNWEGHNVLESPSLLTLVDMIKQSTTQEIQNEFNRLSEQHLWNDVLVDVFYEELRNRIMEEPTFVFSTNWFELPGWIENPFMTFQIGYNDYYAFVDRDGGAISTSKAGLTTFALNSEHFSEVFSTQIIRMIIRTHAHNLSVRVQVDHRRTTPIQIIGLINDEDEEDFLNFLNNGAHGGQDIQLWFAGDSSKVEDGQIQVIDVPLTVAETIEFLILRRMINELQDETFGVVDPDLTIIYNRQDKEDKKLAIQELRTDLVNQLGQFEVERLEASEELDFGEVDDFEE